MKPVAPDEHRWELLKQLLDVSTFLVFAALSVALGAGRIEQAFSDASSGRFPLAQLSAVLFILTLLVVAFWYYSVAGEMQMLKYCAKEYVPPLPKSRFYAALVLALFLAALVLASNRPLLYSALYAGLKLGEIWSMWLRDSKIAEGLEAARSRSGKKEGRTAYWESIEDYYLRKPQVHWVSTELSLAAAAAVLAAYGELHPDPGLRSWFSSASYTVLIVTILLNFAVFTHWRAERDRLLKEPFD